IPQFRHPQGRQPTPECARHFVGTNHSGSPRLALIPRRVAVLLSEAVRSRSPDLRRRGERWLFAAGQAPAGKPVRRMEAAAAWHQASLLATIGPAKKWPGVAYPPRWEPGLAAV